MNASNVQCNGCGTTCHSLGVYIHCMECSNFDLCWDCYRAGVTAQGHRKFHTMATIICEMSALNRLKEGGIVRYNERAGTMSIACDVCRNTIPHGTMLHCCMDCNTDICKRCFSHSCHAFHDTRNAVPAMLPTLIGRSMNPSSENSNIESGLFQAQLLVAEQEQSITRMRLASADSVSSMQLPVA